MNNTTNTRIANGRSISTLRLASLSVGLFLIATVPVLANGQKETLPKTKTTHSQPVVRTQRTSAIATKTVNVKPITSTTPKETVPVTKTTTVPTTDKPVAKSGNGTDAMPVSTGNNKVEVVTGRPVDVKLNEFHPVLNGNQRVEDRLPNHILTDSHRPVIIRGREFGIRTTEFAAFSAGIFLMGMVTLPAAPPVINQANVQTVVDFKLALIAADIKDLQGQIQDRQSREADITNGNVPGADPQQVPSMQAVDRSNQHEIDNLQAEADAIPKMTPEGQLKIARANFNSHISKLKRNKKSLENRKAQLLTGPQSDGRDNAIDQIDAQIGQDETDINTLQQMSDQATALLK